MKDCYYEENKEFSSQ